MTKLSEVYKCNVCGNIVEVIHTGVGQLVCCGKPMELLQEKTQEEGLEKHVPVIEKTATGIKVKVGSIAHPMEENHYIEWIQLFVNGQNYRQFLKPGEAPEAEFKIVVNNMAALTAREFCNVHGLWRSKQ